MARTVGLRRAIVVIAAAFIALAVMLAPSQLHVRLVAGNYPQTILADGPSMYYRLDDATGPTLVDASGNGHNATYGSGVGFGASGAMAGVGGDAAVAPNGNVAGVYSSGVGAPLGAAARTTEGWVRTVDGSIQDLVSWGGTSGTGTAFAMRMRGNGTQVEVVTWGDDLVFTTTNPINDGNWHLLDATYDGNVTVTAYLDGQSLGAKPLTASLNTQSGQLDVGGSVWCGCEGILNTNNGLDEVAVYPSALSATQIANHFTASGNTVPTAPVGVTATAGSNQAAVTWTASTASVPAGQPAVAGYAVTAYQGSTLIDSVSVAGTATSATVTGLQGGVAYTVQVSGRNGFGGGLAGTSPSVTPTGSTTTYASTVLADGPFIRYRLDDPTGPTMIDSSGNVRNATYGSDIGFQTTGALAGDSDTAVSPNGNVAGTYVSGAGEPLAAAARTAEGWLRTVSGSNQDLVSWGNTSNNGTLFGVEMGGNGNAIVLRLSNLDISFNAPRSIDDGNWHLLDVTYDGNVTLTAYLDGQSLGSQTLPAALTTQLSQLDVGGSVWCGCEAIQGTTNGLDEVAVYPSALSAAQIANHFIASGDTRPTVPTTVTATAATNQATVTWTASTASVPAGQTAVTGYMVTAYKGSTAVNSTSVVATATSATVPGLQGGVAYTLQVSGLNSFGTGSPGTSPSVTPTGSASTYASTVLADGAGFLYRLDDSGPQLADSAGGHHAVASSAITRTVAGALPSDSDTAVSPNGNVAGTYVSGAGEPLAATARTAEGWLRTVSGSNQDLVSWGNTSNNGTLFGMEMGGNGNAIVLRLSNQDVSFNAPRSIDDGNWHLLDATYDGNVTLTAYLDGQTLGSQTLSGALNTALSQLDVGGSVWCGCEAIQGTTNGLDEVAVYPSALSAAQIANHFIASGNALQPGVPQPPQNVTATGGDSQATVSWSAPSYDGGSPITGYTVTPYIGSTAQTPSNVGATPTTTTISQLTNGTTYTFQVTASNIIGSSTPATSNAVTPVALPGAPTNVKATATDTHATVTWTAPGAPGSVVTKYTVTPYVGTTAQSALAVTVTTLYHGAVNTTANVGGLTDGTSYTFQVTATNDTGTGPPGTSAAVTPKATAPLKLAPAKGYDSGSTPVHAVIGDLTGNGWPDILTANAAGNNVSALLNQVKGGGHAGGTFAQPASLSSAGAVTSQVALGDFNGDGKLDAAVVSGASTVGVMLGNGNGTFAAETGVQTLSNQNANVVAVADMNGDGKLDIVVAGGLTQYPNGTAVDVLLGNGDGTFQAPVQYPIHDVCLGCGFSATGLALADLNGDGLPDIVYTNNNTSSATDSGAMYALLNQVGGTFNVTSPVPTPTGIPGLHSSVPGETVAVADINHDGIPDVVTVEDPIYVGLNGSGGQRGISISFGTGGGGADATFLPPVYVRDPALTDGANPPNDAGDVGGLAIADMNGDGLPDIVTADSSSFSGPGGVSVYLNRGGGSIDAPTFIPTANFTPRGVTLGDVNGDSEPDVVLQNNLAVGQSVPSNVLVLINGTDFPPLGGPLTAGEMHGCAMCQAMRGGGALVVSGSHPITVNSGEMSHTFSDLSIPARGYALSVTQTYNDLNAGTDSGLGYGWWSSVFMSVTQDGATGITTVTQENGGQAQFWTSSLQPLAPRTQATLVHNGDGTWTFTRYNSTTLTFNSSGKITSMADLTGDSLNFGYTGSQVTSLTHSDGRSLAIAWTSGHISSITDATVSGTTRTASFTYDASSQLTDIDWKVNGANDRNEHFEYESAPWNHGMTGMRDARGIWVTQVYDSSGRTVSQIIDPTAKDASGLNRITTYAYTVTGGSISQALITDPAGHQEQDTFAYGELTQKILGYGSASAATWSYTYDPSSVGTRMAIDPNSNTATASYDVYGNPLAATDALGRTTSYSYAGNGGADAKFNQPTTATDPNGVTTTNSYDAAHRTLTQTSTPLVGSSPAVSQVIQYQHTTVSHPGDLTATVDGDGKTTSYGYDTYGNRTSTTDPLGNKASTTYNARGWVLTTITPKGDPSVCTGTCTPAQYTTTYSYVDSSGNTNFWGAATAVTDPLSHKTSTVYDNNNNVIQLTDGNGKVTSYDFDNANEPTVTHRADATHTTVKTDYNADETISDQIDGKGNTVQSYGYNSLAQQTTVTADPGSSPHLNLTTTFAYDGVGNVLTKQAPGGSCTGTISGCTTYSHDAAYELTGISYSDGTTPNVSSVQYDADGQRTAMTDGTGAWAWHYDTLHRLTSVTEGTNGTVSYQYNLRNLVTQITYPVTGHIVTQTYDDSGRMSTVKDWNNATTTLNYDHNSNLSEADLASGTALKDTSTFNKADQLISIADTYNSSTVFAATYTRDGNAQVTSDTSATTSQKSYAYTPLNQVCYAGSNSTSACTSPPSGSQPFAYDAADNLTTIGTAAQTFNTADQLTASASTTYQYDTRGNRTGRTAGSTVTSYGYDQANRLCWTGPTSSGAGCAATVQTSDTVYCYNGAGLRMAKVTAGTCAAPTTSEKFTWDASGSLPLLLSDGATEYVYGPSGLPLEQVNGATTLWYHHDQLGSTRAMTNATGTVKGTYKYDPYGNVLSCTGATVSVAGVNICTGTISVSNPFDFSGQYRDGESGNYYLRARYYDPASTQFLTRDPLAVTTRSPYAYVVGNPLNRSDPSGRDGACSGCYLVLVTCSPGVGLEEEYLNGHYYSGETCDQVNIPGAAWGGNGADTGGATTPADVNRGHYNDGPPAGSFDIGGRLDAGLNNAGQGVDAGAAVFGTGGCLIPFIGCFLGTSVGSLGGALGGFVDGFCTDTKLELPPPWAAVGSAPSFTTEGPLR